MAKALGLDGQIYKPTTKLAFKITAIGLAWDANKEKQEDLRKGQKDQIAEAVTKLSVEQVRELLD